MSAHPVSQKWLRPLAGLVSFAIVLGLLSWARGILIPVAVAILSSFVLTPAVTALQRHRLRRTPAVVLVVTVTGLMFASLGWLVSVQLSNLAQDLPTYSANIRKKLAELRDLSKGGPFQKITESIRVLERDISPEEDTDRKPIPLVRTLQEPPSPLNQIVTAFRERLSFLGGAGLALMLLIAMLINREDLRDRVIALIGPARITLSTVALDDAGKRVSRYLLMQLLVNGSFGIAVGIGLFFLGIPYALLWALLATLLRYIPYVGPYVAAVPPVVISLGTSTGWLEPFLVFGLFLVLALFTSMVVEPSLYGRIIGVSGAALIVALAFWAWVWGWMGMILAVPLTVCLIVLGRHVPALKFFDVLMGDQPALEAPLGYYQRLLARDQDEASDNTQDYLNSNSLQQVYDDLLIPALTYAERDLDNGDLTEDDHRFVLAATQEIAEELATVACRARPDCGKTSEPSPDADGTAIPAKVQVLACPAHDEADALALRMFQQLLDPNRCEITLTTTALLAAEFVSLVEEKNPAAVCIASLPPGGLAHCRYLCLRLRARFPDLKIVVGRWGLKENLEKNREQLLSAGADQFATTLLETRDQLASLVQLLAHRQPQKEMQP